MKQHRQNRPEDMPVVELCAPAPGPLTRAPVKGWVKAVFWGLRVYIVAMLVLVLVGFARGAL